MYLCGKGITRNLKPGSPSERLLNRMRAAFRKRCEEMTKKVSAFLHESDPSLSLSFNDVVRLTPHGNVTERHIAQAVTEIFRRRYPKTEDLRSFLKRLIGDFEEKELLSEDRFQDLIRDNLLKAGELAYVEEPPEAFPSIKKIVKLFRDYGAIPTYPVLGNPITEKEANIDVLFDDLENYGIFAVEVIPKRNTRERLIEILEAAKKHNFPVFNGTEHNTKSPEPLLDNFSADPMFSPIFLEGAYLVIGHQFLSKYAGKGYIDSRGRLTFPDRQRGISLFSFTGKLTWSEKTLDWLSKIGRKNVLKVILALYAFLGLERAVELRIMPDFRIPRKLMKRIAIEDDHLSFMDEEARTKTEMIVRNSVSIIYQDQQKP